MENRENPERSAIRFKTQCRRRLQSGRQHGPLHPTKTNIDIWPRDVLFFRTDKRSTSGQLGSIWKRFRRTNCLAENTNQKERKIIEMAKLNLKRRTWNYLSLYFQKQYILKKVAMLIYGLRHSALVWVWYIPLSLSACHCLSVCLSACLVIFMQLF